MKQWILALSAALVFPAGAHAQSVVVPSPVPAFTANCVLQYNASTQLLECNAIGAVAQPLTDGTGLIADNADATKILAFQLSGLTTGTTRTWTIPDANITIPTTIASLAANTFTGLQTMNGGLAATTGTFSSTLGVTGAFTGTSGAFSTTLAVTGATTFSGQVTSQGASAGLYLSSRDGSGAQWLAYNPTGDGLDFYNNVAAATVARMTNAGDFWILPAKKFYFDGGSNTYIHEMSADILQVVAGGSSTMQLADSGVIVGAPTGSFKGAGTLNAVAVYDDNVLLTDWVFDLFYDGGETSSQQQRPPSQAMVLPDVRLALRRGPKRLYSLDDVRKVTEAERRLPWMPTKESFELQRATGWMITSLWQGQEQQMLYLFDHATRISGVEAQLTALAARLASLENKEK